MSIVKNALKVKQLAKQPATLKTIMQKILVGFWVKKFKFTEAKFLHNCFLHNLIVYNNI